MIAAFIIAAASLVVGAPIKVDAAMLATLPVRQAVLTAHGSTQRCEGPLFADHATANRQLSQSCMRH